MLTYELIKTDKKTGARAGIIHTDHGDIETPIFMPVGTIGNVKSMTNRDLEEARAQIILGNTYHLHMRPGKDLINRAGGLHKFMNWNKPILTDSGGFQVFSLAGLSKITDKGALIQSHIDGSKHFFNPELVMDIQRNIGSDIQMVIDECAPYPSTKEYALKALKRTTRWAKECRDIWVREEPLYGHYQSLFPIVQGSTYHDLRRISCNEIMELDPFEGYAIGGVSVGEPPELIKEITQVCTEILPKNKPRYLMGVGTPQDLLNCIEVGVDMFDCVMPTRNARNGTVFTSKGKLVLKGAKFKEDFNSIDKDCDCFTCRNYTRAYVRHLYNAKEMLSGQLASIHNIHFYLWLAREARKAIMEDRYYDFKKDIMSYYE
ncbi:MAG: tRNA guanosine(34) transglycosylase Tgt [Candidatus Cloacimonadota bacterium]|nr:MAG: tRNA guanosine(34) transglycosylase Tgt [Candidatus Cloacimonadota bacterium]PIE78700.1 MAG: tRNA guanosine(34) transglycosylase Tgt [Candidatus Delongbacteria bacterium]